MPIHQLTPKFILDQLRLECTSGTFEAVALFVDTSGFTPLTAALMQHGTEGAEALAEVLANVFEPLIDIIHAQGGFIAGFAGDALKALFPYADGDAHMRAVRAAWRLSNHANSHHIQLTRFGPFEFNVKACVGDGMVTWEILQGERTADAQHAAYIFDGEAIVRSLELDNTTEAGQVSITHAVYDQLEDGAIDALVHTNHVEVVGLRQDDAASAARRSPKAPKIIAEDDHADAFHSRQLLESNVRGEFRQVVTIFLNLKEAPAPSEREEFHKAFFRLLRQYGGFLCRYGRVGDWDGGGSFLLFWGAPISHENDVERALDFLLALRAAAPVPIRAGVTRAMAFAGFVGSEQSEEYTCYGSYVNLSARHTKAAGWNEILLDAETARSAELEFNVVATGKRQFKGFADPLPVFQLTGRGEQASALWFQGTMVGRQHELRHLQAAVEPIFHGSCGGVALVTGEAGIGKSRLLYEFRQQLNSTAVSWMSGQTDEILRMPLNPFRYCLKRYFQPLEDGGAFPPDGSSEHVLLRASFATKLQQLIDAVPDPELGAELRRTESFLAALLDLRWDGSLYEQVEPELRLENTLQALKTFFKALSLHQPLIILIEDAQWLDGESLTFLKMLLRNVTEYPFLLLLVTRVQGIGLLAGLPNEMGSTRIDLTTLEPEQLRQIAADILHGDIGPELTDLITTRGDGNPFFAEQLTLYLREQSLVEQGPSGWRLRAGHANTVAIPDDVRSVLTARLDRLATPVKVVVQTASVLGREFDVATLTHMLGSDHDIEKHLDAATNAAIWSAIEQTYYLFRHALLRDAAYDMQLRARLRRLHANAAQAIEQLYSNALPARYADLAYHCDRGELNAEAVKWYELATGEAAAQYANADAVRFSTRALDLINEEDFAERYRLLLAREAALNWLGKRDEQADDLEKLQSVADHLPDKLLSVELSLRQLEHARLTSNFDAAMHHVESAIKQADMADESFNVARSRGLKGRLLLNTADYVAAREQLLTAIEIAGPAGYHQVEAQAVYDLGRVYDFQGHFSEAQTHFEQAQSIFAQLNDRKGEINCLFMFGTIEAKQGNFDVAREYLEEALSLCQASGWRYGETDILGNLGTVSVETGNFERARVLLERALAVSLELNDTEGSAIFLDTLGLLDYFCGEYAPAQESYRQALAIQRRIGDRYGQGYTLTHVGHNSLALGDVATAEECFSEALEIRQALSRNSGTAMDDLAGLASVSLVRGKQVEAIRFVDKILQWTENNSIQSAEYPVQIYLICYHILAATEDIERATSVLNAGHALLTATAAAIKDEEVRNALLKNIPFNRELIAAWSKISD